MIFMCFFLCIVFFIIYGVMYVLFELKIDGVFVDSFMIIVYLDIIKSYLIRIEWMIEYLVMYGMVLVGNLMCMVDCVRCYFENYLRKVF